jgi:hypothetical protein
MYVYPSRRCQRVIDIEQADCIFDRTVLQAGINARCFSSHCVGEGSFKKWSGSKEDGSKALAQRKTAKNTVYMGISLRNWATWQVSKTEEKEEGISGDFGAVKCRCPPCRLRC